MKVVAHTFDGMNINKEIEVDEVSIWIDKECRHKPTITVVNELVKMANKTGQMQIYDGGFYNGKIDAFGDTPLYTNGQVSVRKLEVNGEIVWERF